MSFTVLEVGLVVLRPYSPDEECRSFIVL